MDLGKCIASIEELEAIKSSISSRIAQIREENGIDQSDFFDEKIGDAIETIETLIDDRCENEDIPVLWEVRDELKRLEDKIFEQLRGLRG